MFKLDFWPPQERLVHVGLFLNIYQLEIEGSFLTLEEDADNATTACGDCFVNYFFQGQK